MRTGIRRLAHAVDTEQAHLAEKTVGLVVLPILPAVTIVRLVTGSPDLSIPIAVGNAVLFVGSIMYMLRHINRETSGRHGPFPLLPSAAAIISATCILIFLDRQGTMLYLPASLLTLGVALGIAGYWQKYRHYRRTRQHDQ